MNLFFFKTCLPIRLFKLWSYFKLWLPRPTWRRVSYYRMCYTVAFVVLTRPATGRTRHGSAKTKTDVYLRPSSCCYCYNMNKCSIVYIYIGLNCDYFSRSSVEAYVKLEEMTGKFHIVNNTTSIKLFLFMPLLCNPLKHKLCHWAKAK